MPIFEYRCRECGAVTEMLQGVGKGDAVPQCKSCGSISLTRLFSAPFVKTNRSQSSGEQYCCESGKGPQCTPGECSSGNWPENDDYIRLKDS